MWTLVAAYALMADVLGVTPAPMGPPGSWAAGATPLFEGPLSAVDVRRGIEGVESPVLRCYQALIAQYPGGIGAVEARFVVTSEGAPTELSVAGGPVAAPWSQGCVEDALGGARFVSSSGETAVSWTLTLDEQASRLRYVGGYFPS